MNNIEIKCPTCNKKLGIYNENGVYLINKQYDAEYVGNHIVVTGKCCDKDLLLEIFTQDDNIKEHDIRELDTEAIDKSFKEINEYETISKNLYNVCLEINGTELCNMKPSYELLSRKDYLMDKLVKLKQAKVLEKAKEVSNNCKILDDNKLYYFNLTLNTLIPLQHKVLKRDFGITID